MRNKIIEATIDQVVDKSTYSTDFKMAFKQFVKNIFDDNAKESDLKRILSLLDDVVGEELDEINLDTAISVEMQEDDVL